VHRVVAQFLGRHKPRTCRTTRLACPRRHHAHPEHLQDGLGVDAVFIAGDLLGAATTQAALHVLQQLHRVLCDAPADEYAQHQAAVRVEGDVVPLVATEQILVVSRVAVLLLFADEGPLFIELELGGRGGKSPPPRRGGGGRGRRHGGPGE